MMHFENGFRFKDWVIRTLLRTTLAGKEVFRSEYLLNPDKAHPGYEYRVIVYDMKVTPESMVWNSRRHCDDPQEYSTPFELKFLRSNKSAAFPEVVRHEEVYPYHWVVIRTPERMTLAEYIRAHPPKDTRKSVGLVLKVCRALEELNQFYGAHHYNLGRQAVYVTPEGNVILDELIHIARTHFSRTFGRKLSARALSLAPEVFQGIWSENADIYSVSLILYALVSRRNYPWNIPSKMADHLDAGSIPEDDFIEWARIMWKRPPSLDSVEDPLLRGILWKGLATGSGTRFSSLEAFRKALEDYLRKNPDIEEPVRSILSGILGGLLGYAEKKEEPLSIRQRPRKSGGFADLAGMDELKEELTWKFINPIKYKGLARGYGISPPNGCLLYGPPGCGKTFAAEKIAEEAGIGFRLCRPSEIASTYVHGGQSLIKQIFDEARHDAPILLCWDEADAIATSRERLHEHYAGEVNELLTQMNNAATDGVYVFLMSNCPEKLDPAVLRRGRIDEKFYVPLPDEKGREEMLRMRSTGLPLAGKWDFRHLASLCDGFSFADLEYVMAECRRLGFRMAVAGDRKAPLPLRQDLVEGILRRTVPSVSREERARFEDMHQRMTGCRDDVRRRIGF